MAKLTREEKIEIYNKRMNGESSRKLSLEYGIHVTGINYLVRLVDYHGESILRNTTNRLYSKKLKQEIMDRVIIENHSIKSVAIEYGLSSSGMLTNWIKSYKENNCVIVEKKKGRSPTTMTKKEDTKEIKSYDSMSSEEKIKHLENKALYLEAENEYLKKLHAVIQKKKQQSKKK